MGEKILTEELREEMFGLLPFSASETFTYVPKCFEKFPEELRPIFTLRSVEDTAKKRMFTLLKAGDKIPDEQFREVTRKYVVGWEQLYDLGTMEVIPYEVDEDGGAKKVLFASIPSKVVGEVLAHLSRVSGLTDIEREALTS